jgi:hypothetical protein
MVAAIEDGIEIPEYGRPRLSYLDEKFDEGFNYKFMTTAVTPNGKTKKRLVGHLFLRDC